METRIKEHHQHILLGHPDKYAVAEHRFNHNHFIEFQDKPIVSTATTAGIDCSRRRLSWRSTLRMSTGRMA
jgi:hypothetical protein